MRLLVVLTLFYLSQTGVLGLECSRDCYQSDQLYHHVKGISGHEVVSLKSEFAQKSLLESIFKNINLLRPIGSENHFIVRKYITGFMEALGWKVDLDQFWQDTVIGKVKFNNIIATLDPSKPRKLVLACHYESKMQTGFYGSIDSAMPCSIMLSTAEKLTNLLKKSNLKDVTLQFIFFDGEEAFHEWSDTDSIYGSRHLANKWNEQIDNCGCSVLKSIDTLILLDLLGAKDSKFYNFQDNNMKMFETFSKIEKRISYQNGFARSQANSYSLFSDRVINYKIGDDHVPFMKKNVPILHLIPVPFPSQWHDNSDNASNIDWDLSHDLELILATFIAEYFHLSIPAHSMVNG